MSKGISHLGKQKAHRNVIVVGASAGGLEALSTFVAGMPSDFPAAILIVLHIPRQFPSILHEILERRTSLPVTQAKDREAIKSGHIYVAGPDRHLMIDGNQMRLTRGPLENHVRPCINVLFRSAAYSLGPRVIGIVMSGTLDDGTAGLWTIKDQGGMAMVQLPAEAICNSMPLNAIKYVTVDAVLPVAEMPSMLGKWVSEEIEVEGETTMPKHMETEHKIALGKNEINKEIVKLGTPSMFTCPECHGTMVQVTEGSIIRFRCHTGHAYSQKALLTDINSQIDINLWNTIRVIEERVMILNQMAEQVRGEDEATLYKEQAQKAEKRLEVLRGLVLDEDDLGHDAAESGELER